MKGAIVILLLFLGVAALALQSLRSQMRGGQQRIEQLWQMPAWSNFRLVSGETSPARTPHAIDPRVV